MSATDEASAGTTGGRALIAGAATARSALGGVRALHAAGWEVGVASQERGLAGSTSSTKDFHQVGRPGEDPEGFIDLMAELCSSYSYDVVLGAGDAEMTLLSAHRDRLAAKLPLPDHDRFLAALDKLTLSKSARAAGIATPDMVELDATTSLGFDRPVVVKPVLHFPVPGPTKTDRLSVAVARSQDELESAAAAIAALGGRPVAQEFIEGSLVAVSLVRDGAGELRAVCQQRAERTWPRDVGVSAFARTVEVDQGLLERIEILLDDLHWQGIAQLQFVDPPVGEPHLIDLNPRLYGSVLLAVNAGANLPAIGADVALGRPLEGPPAIARPGVAFQWLEGDVRQAMSAPKGHRARALREVRRGARSAIHPVVDVRDVGPTFQSFRRLPRRTFRFVRRPSG